MKKRSKHIVTFFLAFFVLALTAVPAFGALYALDLPCGHSMMDAEAYTCPLCGVDTDKCTICGTVDEHGCNPGSSHSHSYSYGSWQEYNSTQHKRLGTCSCGDTSIFYQNHSYKTSGSNPVIYECTVCGYSYAGSTSTYTITFNSNGGSAVSSLTKQTSIPSNIHTAYIPTRDGYTFDGWYTTNSLSTKATAGQTLTSNISLYAKWIAIPQTTYTITFNSMSGSQIEAISGVTYIYEHWDSGYIPELNKNIVPVRSGYTFDGWYYDYACTRKVVEFDEVTSDITVYAKWTAETPFYSISYYVWGNIWQTVRRTEMPSSFPDPVASGYVTGATFEGWYYDSAFTRIASVNDELSSNINLYAKMTITEEPDPTTPEPVTPPEPITTYTITFNSMGGSLVRDISGVTEIPDLPYSVRYGYTFSGWYIDSNYTTRANVGAKLTDNITLYASWTLNENVDLYVDGGDALRGMFTGLTESTLSTWLTVSSQIGFGGITILSITVTIAVILLIWFVIKIVKG